MANDRAQPGGERTATLIRSYAALTGVVGQEQVSQDTVSEVSGPVRFSREARQVVDVFSVEGIKAIPRSFGSLCTGKRKIKIVCVKRFDEIDYRGA
jgi:hypothetical protein